MPGHTGKTGRSAGGRWRAFHQLWVV